MTEIIFEPEAEADVLNAFAWYENQRRGLGLLFRGALDAALERIEREPRAFPVQVSRTARASSAFYG